MARSSFSPDWSATANYKHEFSLPNGGIIAFYGDMQWTSWQYVNNNLGQSVNPAQVSLNPIGALAARQDAYWLGDLSLSYSTPKDNFTTSLWVRNVGNEAIKSSASLARSPPVWVRHPWRLITTAYG